MVLWDLDNSETQSETKRMVVMAKFMMEEKAEGCGCGCSWLQLIRELVIQWLDGAIEGAWTHEEEESWNKELKWKRWVSYYCTHIKSQIKCWVAAVSDTSNNGMYNGDHQWQIQRKVLEQCEKKKTQSDRTGRLTHCKVADEDFVAGIWWAGR